MRNVFVINPKSGNGRASRRLIRNIRSAGSKNNQVCEIYLTKGPGDAERFIKAYLKHWSEEQVRLYMCGGDGTVNEGVDALMHLATESGQLPSAALGVVPVGSGNDFLRSFTNHKEARDIEKQLRAKPAYCDVLRITGQIEGEEKTLYCDNILNIGFDCDTVDTTNRLRSNPLILPSFSYAIGALVTLIKKRGVRMHMEAEEGTLYDGKLLLTCIGNGSYCGGGMKTNPMASLHDGIMDINLVKDISRLRFLMLFPLYMKGKHMQKKGIEKYIRTEKTSRVKITPLDGKMRICIDGETCDAGEITVETIKDAFRILIP
ncbi:MAG: hypothetical protein J6P72_11345 [Firmicutes bacterium]|nr:hypothetical protein [Bacillota bacterium]